MKELNKIKKNNYSKPPNLIIQSIQSLFKKFQQKPNIFFGFSLKMLPFRNISITVRVNIAFISTFFKEHLIRFLMISRLIDFASVIL